MFRTALFALRSIRPLSTSHYIAARIICNDFKTFSTFKNVTLQAPLYNNGSVKGSLLCNKQIIAVSNNITAIPVRSVTKFSLKKGKRKTVKAVIKRFFRLHWGGWIRTKVGRHKRLWKKSPPQRRRLKDHVLCNATQTTLLDKMVTKYWKRPKYYVDDPYAPYHTREEFLITRKKPIDRK